MGMTLGLALATVAMIPVWIVAPSIGLPLLCATGSLTLLVGTLTL